MPAVMAQRQAVQPGALPRFDWPASEGGEPQAWRDPYAAYTALRESAPLVWSDQWFGGAWLLTRHADVEALLRDSRFSAQRTGAWVTSDAGERRAWSAFQRLFARALVFLDAPDHGRLRSIMQAGFKPAALQGLREQIETLADELLDEIDASTPPAQPFDFIARFARLLPSRVIAAMMGVPRSEEPLFMAWSEGLADFLGAAQPTSAQALRAQDCLVELCRYFEREVLPDARAAQVAGQQPQTLVARLVQAQAAGEVLGTIELLAQCAMLLFAGHETTRHLLGTAVYHLLREPGAWRQLAAEPAGLPLAVRELLRYECPVQYTGRRVTTDTVWHGQTLRRGDLVLAMLGSACRDEARFASPGQLDLARRDGSMLAFGHGPHVCVGAAMTLMEAEVALQALMRRWPDLQLAQPGGAPAWMCSPLYRGLTQLPLLRGAVPG